MNEPLDTRVYVPDAVRVAYFLAASRDRNPIHVSAASAHDAGLAAPIVPGPMSTAIAYLEMVKRHGISAVSDVRAAFHAPLLVGAATTLTLVDERNWHFSADGNRPAVSGAVILRGDLR